MVWASAHTLFVSNREGGYIDFTDVLSRTDGEF